MQQDVNLFMRHMLQKVIYICLVASCNHETVRYSASEVSLFSLYLHRFTRRWEGG
jgi:hypothetical protein